MIGTFWILVCVFAVVGVVLSAALVVDHIKTGGGLTPKPLPPHLMPYDHPPEVLAELYDEEALKTLGKQIAGLRVGRDGIECQQCGMKYNCKCEDGPIHLLADRMAQALKIRAFHEATAGIQFAFDKEIGTEVYGEIEA